MSSRSIGNRLEGIVALTKEIEAFQAPPLPASDMNDAGPTSGEARRLLTEVGPSTTPDTSMHPPRRASGKFWAPVPWMPEVTVVPQPALGKDIEAAVVAGLLEFDAALGWLQEGRAQSTRPARTPPPWSRN